MTIVNEEEQAKAGALVQIGPYVTPAQKERIRLVAFERRISASEIFREALDEWFDKHCD